MNEATGKYIPITDATLDLHREVRIPAGRTRIFFQQGSMAYAAGEFQPHCQLTVRQLLTVPQLIHPDTFSIGRVSYNIQYVVDTGNLKLASLADQLLVDGNGGGNGEGMQTQVYIMQLHSETQPHVQHLICGGAFEFPALAKRPSLQEINNAMGDYAALTLH